MKHKLKNYFKHGILLFGISLLLINCQKDDAQVVSKQQNLNNDYQVVSLEEIPSLIPVINNVKRVLPKSSATTNREGVEFIGLDNVNVDNVVKITNESGKSTYTFRIDNPESTSINFENLHLVEVDNGYLAYILSYEPTEEWYYSTYTPEGELVFDMNSYQGNMTKYNLQREVIWSTELSETARGQTMVECTISLVPTCFNNGFGGIGDEHLAGGNCNGPFSSAWVETCSTVYTGGGSPSDTASGGGGGGGTSTEVPCIPGADGTNTQPLSGNFVGDGGEVAEETSSECVENNIVTVLPAGITKFEMSLSLEQKVWWNDLENNGQEVAAIINYLILNGYALDSMQLAQQAVVALMNDDDIKNEVLFILETNCNTTIEENLWEDNFADNEEPKWGQLANKNEILNEINNVSGLSTLSYNDQITALANHFKYNLKYDRDDYNNGELVQISNLNPSTPNNYSSLEGDFLPISKDVNRYVYSEVGGWIDFHHVFKIFEWATQNGPFSAITMGEMGEMWQSLKDNNSAYSYEDLPSNYLGVAMYLRFSQDLALGNITWYDAVQTSLNEISCIEPENAPNFEYIPHIVNEHYPQNFTYTPLLGNDLKNYHKEKFCERPFNEQINIKEAHENFDR